MTARVPRTEREIEVWNAAIAAAAAVCREVDEAAYGQGHRMPSSRGGGMRARRGNSSANPHAHRSAELSLGAQRCLGAIQDLRR